MHTAAFTFFALAQAALAIVAIRLYRRRRANAPLDFKAALVSGDLAAPSTLFLILPIAGVVWDNAIMVLGARIGDGPLLTALSWPRFIGHALLTPSWIIAAFGFAARARLLARQQQPSGALSPHPPHPRRVTAQPGEPSRRATAN